MNVLITGAAGYIGAMLLDRLAGFPEIDTIYGIDLKPRPAIEGDVRKVHWICADIAQDEWLAQVQDRRIDVVVHCAYQIRELYGSGRARQRHWNVDGARKVFEFALTHPSVRRVIQLSTVSAYGALPANSADRPLTEEDPLSEDDYLYGIQKKQVETLLWGLCRRLPPSAHVVVLRLASVSGPRGRFGLKRYGLLSTIAGRFPCLVCGRTDWGRQYLHEDDLIDVLTTFVLSPPATGYQVFNLSPPDFLDGASIGRLFNKRAIAVPPPLLRALFWLLWHGTRGAVTTPAGAWRFLSYPIRVDASHLQRTYGYACRYSSLEALTARQGRYADPPTSRLRPRIDQRGAA